MVKSNAFSVAALMACLVAVNAAGIYPLQDEDGNRCPSCPTTKELNPVCGSNGVTYSNPGVLECHSKCLKSKMTLKHYGQCHLGDLQRKVKQEYDCPCISTKELRPVCGSNGETYSNPSVLKCAAMCQKTIIRVKHQGKC